MGQQAETSMEKPWTAWRVTSRSIVVGAAIAGALIGIHERSLGMAAVAAINFSIIAALVCELWLRLPTADDLGAAASSVGMFAMVVASALFAIGIPLALIFGLVRFVKWAWTF